MSEEHSVFSTTTTLNTSGPITTNSILKVLDPNLDSTGLLALLASSTNLFFTSVISGTYNIAGRYCEPEVYIESRQQTLQLLAHPATYDRNYVGL